MFSSNQFEEKSSSCLGLPRKLFFNVLSRDFQYGCDNGEPGGVSRRSPVEFVDDERDVDLGELIGDIFTRRLFPLVLFRLPTFLR